MIKKITLLAVLLKVTMSFGQTELLTDPGFENTTNLGDNTQHWHTSSPSLINADPTYARSGIKSGNLSADAAASSNLLHNIDLIAGNTYKVEFYMRDVSNGSTKAVTTSMRIGGIYQLLTPDPDNTVGNLATSCGGCNPANANNHIFKNLKGQIENTWQKSSFLITAATTATHTLHIQHGKGDSENIYIDDFSVKEEGTTQEKITDGGFDNIADGTATNGTTIALGDNETPVGTWFTSVTFETTIGLYTEPTGDKAIKLINNLGNNSSIKQLLDLHPGTYVCSYKVKKVNADEGNDEKVLKCSIRTKAGNINQKINNGTTGAPNGNNDLWNTARSLLSHTAYTTVEFVFVIDATDSYQIFIQLQPDASGSPLIIDDVSITPIQTTEWTGATDTDWATASNWDNDVPTVSLNATIPSGTANHPVISATTAAVANDITTNNDLTIASGGSLIVRGTSTGDVTYNRNLTTENWYLVSSPVASETYDDAYVTANSLAINGTNNAIGSYAPATNNWSYMQTGAAANFTAGQGYSVRLATGQNAGDISFTGTINTESVETSSLAVGFNLLGNPFTNYVNSATFLGHDTSSNLDQSQIWLWNQATGMYEVKILGDAWVLAPGQGFFVNATSAETVTFRKSNQVGTGNVFQRSEKTELKLVLSDGENNRFAKLIFGDNFSKGFDFGWEGEIFGGIPNSLSIFTSLLEDNVGKRYQIQSLPNSDYESLIVPIGITADASKEIIFSAQALNLPEDIKVFLEDRSNNTFTRLDEANTTYKVTLDEKLDGVGRFYVHTTQSALSIDNVALNSVSIFKTNAATLRVTGLQQGKASISLFNVLGKQVMSTSFEANDNTDISLPKLAKGVYFAQVQTATGKLSKKIILE